MQRLLPELALASLLLWSACADTFIAGDGGVILDGSGGACTKEGETQCRGQRYEVCQGGNFVAKAYCLPPQVCSVAVGGCAQCEPGAQFCVGDEVHSCDSAGHAGPLLQTCQKGFCAGGACTDPCTQALGRRSYVGCSYWPTVTSNSQLSLDFSFAVVVANTWEEPAQITVSTVNNPSVATTTVSGGSVATIPLPWVKNLKGDYAPNGIRTPEKSALEPAGAYHLVSNRPVTVYQFNALDYVLPKECSTADTDPYDGKCYSYSNDASLLLPEHSLEKEYIVISRPTLGTIVKDLFGTPSMVSSPGFFAVTAPKEGNTKVTVTFSANTQAGVGGLAAYNKGQTVDFTVPQGGVLQILSRLPTSNCTATTTDINGTGYCDLSSDTDLTATVIKADKEVAVYAGHNCAFVPYDKWACDHLEEQIYPVKTWGKRYFATQTTSSGKDPSIYRVISADQGNQITFNPADVHQPVTLDEGKFIDVTTTKDVEVTASGRMLVVQYMVGQNYSNLNPGEGAPGDPAMSLAVAVEQYRTNYRFLAPKSYEKNYVNVIAPSNASVNLDDTFIAESEFSAIGSTNYKVAKLAITGGAHRISSSVAFGITSYGVGSYTSYMYPGGLDLKLLLD